MAQLNSSTAPSRAICITSWHGMYGRCDVAWQSIVLNGMAGVSHGVVSILQWVWQTMGCGRMARGGMMVCHGNNGRHRA